jgi:hypothetical protein
MKYPVTTIAALLTLTTAAAAATVTQDENHNTIVDGQPFFPIMQWLQSTSNLDRNVDIGINTFTGVWEQDTNKALSYLDAYQAKGAWGVVHFDADDRIRTHPALLGWIFGDEPDLQSNAVPPSEIMSEFNNIKAADPNHLAFLTLTSRFFPQVGGLPPWMNGDDSYYYDYCAATDVVGFDLYPIYGWCRKDWLAYVGEAQELLRLEYGRNQHPTYQWIECVKCCSRWCSYTERSNRGPFPNEIRAEVWLAIVHGAKAIGYFTHTWRSDDCSQVGDAYYRQYQLTAEQEDELKRTNRQITKLTGVIAQPDAAPVSHRLASGEGRVDTLAKQLGSNLYVIAVNVLHASAGNDKQVEFTLPDSITSSGDIVVYDESRSIQCSINSFTDTFTEAAPVHIYVIPVDHVAPSGPKRLKIDK